jgi:riboflavin transporter FmnP
VKRAFLFGLGSFFIIAAIASLVAALIRTAGLAGVIVALICMSLGVVVIRKASLAPAHRSRLHAVFGWLLGFLVIDAAIFAAIGVAILIPLLLK